MGSLVFGPLVFGPLIFGPLGLAAGALVKGHHLVIVPGTHIASEVERTVTVRTPR